MEEKKKKLAYLAEISSRDSKEFLDRLFEPEPVKGEKILKEVRSEVKDKALSPTMEKLIKKVPSLNRVIRGFGKSRTIDAYGKVEIMEVKGETVPLYFVNLPQLATKEKELLDEVKDIAIVEMDIDPDSIPDPIKRRTVFMDKVEELIKSKNPSLPSGRRKILAELIVSDMIGYGPLDHLVADDDLEDIMVIGTKKPVYVVHRKYEVCKTNIVFENEEEIKSIIDKIARPIGRRIDQQTPLLDARLPDGSRVHATIPPVSLDGPTLTISKFREDPLTVIDLMNFNTLNPELAAFLWVCVEGLGIKPANVLCAGGSSCGKTTTVNVLATFVPDTERVITIEDTAELKLPLTHWIRFETRPPNIEGRGEITMDDLVKNTLRMRPDRIIVGEVRGTEARTLFTAMNTGHDGCMGTIHANTAQETITRLTNPPMEVPEIMVPALDLIIMQKRIHHREKGVLRRITEIAEVVGMEGGKIQLNKIYEWDPMTDNIKPTDVPCRLKQEIAEYSGLTGDEINVEIKKREIVLEWLREQGIRDVNAVGREIQAFYQDPDKYLERILEK
ncbi:MAG: CpaF family protein [Candidatus Hydrothermarchaeota archaeon]